MRKLTILMFLMFCVTTIAQSSTVEITNLHYSARGGERICSARLEMEVIYTDNSKYVILEENLGKDDTSKNFYMNPVTVSNNGKVVSRLRFYMHTVSKRGGGCGGDNDEIDETIYIDMNTMSCESANLYFKEANAGSFEVEHSIDFDYKISNGIDVLPNGINDELGYDDNYTVRATPGYSSSSYDWQYRLSDGSIPWTPLPRPSDPNTLIFKASDHLPESEIGKKVQFRINSCYGHPFANIEEFTILNSAPHFKSNPPTDDAKCFGESSGVVTFEFDRPLQPGERLGLEIVDLSKPDVDGTFLQEWSDEITIADMDGNFLTVTGLSGSDSEGFRAQFVGANELYTDGLDHKVKFDIIEPSYVVFAEPTFTDVNCHGGQDGTIWLRASGGTEGNYQFELTKPDGSIDPMKPFDSTYTHTITGLDNGDYSIRIIDGNGCTANEVSDVDNNGTVEIGKEIIKRVTIGEPGAALALVLEDSKDALAAGSTDGSISVRIFGGRPNPDSTYNVTWKNESGTVLTTVDTQVVSDGYFATLRDIGKGKYFVSATDANYDPATGKAGCEITATEFSISEPPPLKANITETGSISCNGGNSYGDTSDDGELTVNASGGVPLEASENRGYQYYYTWKKKTNNSWVVLTDQDTNVASFLDAGTYAVNITDANGIQLPNDVEFELEQPTLLELNIESQNVYCILGEDGWADAVVSGGTPPYTIRWNNGETSARISELQSGTYTVEAIDAKGCRVRGSVFISEPDDVISVDYMAYGRPSQIGNSDGWVVAEIDGGTAKGDGTYNYTWTDENGNILNPQTATEVINGTDTTFQVRLNNIPAGNYFLTIEDANYDAATTKENCRVIQSEYILYDPIEAEINIVVPISCNENNDFLNPFSDGVLEATVAGGLPFENGQPYIYHWKKRGLSGNYVDLPVQTTATASDLSSGSYALNVEDALGNVIGTYDSDILIEATDEEFLFEAPNSFELTLTSTPVSCHGGNDGTAGVSVSGGTGEYTFLWSHGETTPTVDNLIAGKYFVYVKDEKGCEVTGQVTVVSPDALVLNIDEEKAPTCYGGDDGYITSSVNGGIPPYTYSWSTGETTSAINALNAATYHLKVVDVNGCTITQDIELQNPLPDLITLGEDRILCGGQSVTLDASYGDAQTQYSWTSDNGFISNESIVTLSEAGTYEVVITTSSGCSGGDTITVTTSDTEIDAHFVVSTQAFAGQEVALINISSPLGTMVEWFFPPEADIVAKSDETAILLFDTPGAYDIILRSYQGDCYLDFMKSVIVGEAENIPDIGDAENPFIREFLIYPNPSNGSFKVDISLSEPSEVSLKLFSMASQGLVNQRKEPPATTFNLDYGVALASGSYILLLETAKGHEMRKILIQ